MVQRFFLRVPGKNNRCELFVIVNNERTLSNERVAKTVEPHHPGLFSPSHPDPAEITQMLPANAAFIVVIIHSDIPQKTQSGLMLFLIF